jgi:hypothetical protein
MLWSNGVLDYWIAGFKDKSKLLEEDPDPKLDTENTNGQ